MFMNENGLPAARLNSCYLNLIKYHETMLLSDMRKRNYEDVLCFCYQNNTRREILLIILLTLPRVLLINQ